MNYAPSWVSLSNMCPIVDQNIICSYEDISLKELFAKPLSYQSQKHIVKNMMQTVYSDFKFPFDTISKTTADETVILRKFCLSSILSYFKLCLIIITHLEMDTIPKLFKLNNIFWWLNTFSLSVLHIKGVKLKCRVKL